jgi:CubicO group peptidase (beta-lactamase class C family)
MRTGLVVIRTLLLGVVLVACQRKQPAAPDPLQTFVDARVSARVQIVVERDGETLLDRGSAPDEPASIGAISEQFGAALALTLVERGVVTLDEPLAKFATNDADEVKLERVTLRHLLSHTSGLGSGAPLGSQWEDTQVDYEMLGKLLPRIAGEPLPEMLSRLFARAGLKHTAPCPTDEPPVVLAFGLCSTARDLIRWQRALESGAVIGAASYRAMTEAGTFADGAPHFFGLGVAVLRPGGHNAITRSGRERAPSSFLASFPDDKVRIAIVADPGNKEIGWPIVSFQLKLPRPSSRPISTSELSPLEVSFSPPNRSPTHTVVENGRLVVYAPGREKASLVHIGDHVFESEDRATRVRFEMTNGQVGRVIYSYGDYYVAEKPTRT